ncbi:kinase-like protein, partial [Cylindrobasidium torrendii FP15055 ss-10]
VQGLLALEEAGIVHRALSPECILLAEQGNVQLTNFDNATFHHRCNDTGHLFNGIETAYLGEVAEYRAPEVLLGWEADFSADSWGFGLVLFYMSTGQVGHVHYLSYVC